MKTITKQEKDWIYSRCSINDKNKIVFTLRVFIRFFLLLLSLPKILATKNHFIPKKTFGEHSFPKCYVCTKNNTRVSNIFENTLKGFCVFNNTLNLKIAWPDFRRASFILRESSNNNFYSISLIAELFDFMAINEKELNHFDIYATSDGASPLNKVMCLYFKKLEKETIRIVNHSKGPVIDKRYDYNLVTESYFGELSSDWKKIKGTPWQKNTKNHNNHNNHSNNIGIIGAPGPLYLFGIEYWLLLLTIKLKLEGFKPKVRLHPQSNRVSSFLLKYFLQLDVSIHKNENENQFIQSIFCMITSYRTSLIDLALINGCPVMLDNSKISKDKSQENIEYLNLKDTMPTLISKCGEYKNLKNNAIVNKSNIDDLPIIFDLVYGK